MTEIQFYHLTSTPFERALPKLLEKSLRAGFRARVKCASEEKAEALNDLLWTYAPDSFLPHGSAKDGRAGEQPVYLTAGEENPNEADLLIVTDGTSVEADPALKRLLDIFDGTDETAVARARARWKAYQAKGLSATYIKQTAAGGWESQAA